MAARAPLTAVFSSPLSGTGFELPLFASTAWAGEHHPTFENPNPGFHPCRGFGSGRVQRRGKVAHAMVEVVGEVDRFLRRRRLFGHIERAFGPTRRSLPGDGDDGERCREGNRSESPHGAGMLDAWSDRLASSMAPFARFGIGWSLARDGGAILALLAIALGIAGCGSDAPSGSNRPSGIGYEV